MAPIIFDRAAWGARSPKRTPVRLDWSRIRVVDVHWPAAHGRVPTDVAGVARALRGWQAYHMDHQGWADIAYNVAVDLAGRVWLLRGWDVVDGGVAGRSDDVTILAVMGTNDVPTDAMKRSILWCMGDFDRRASRRLRRSHHSAETLPGRSRTACPGSALTAWSKAGFPAPIADVSAITDRITDTDLEDIDMTKEELKALITEVATSEPVLRAQYQALWFGAPGAPLIPQGHTGGGEWPATALGHMVQRTRDEVVSPIVATALAGVQAGADPATITASVRAAVEEAVGADNAAMLQLVADLQATVSTMGEQVTSEMRERLADQLAQVRLVLEPAGGAA